LLNLGLVGAIAFRKLPANLAPPIASVLVLVALGLILGISVARNRHWIIRFFAVAFASGLAFLAWWLVPSWGGVSQWEARNQAARLLNELSALIPGDSDAYQNNLNARNHLLEQFPDYEEQFKKPAAAWLQSSVGKWQTKLSSLSPADFSALGELRKAYEPLFDEEVDSVDVKTALEKAELDWVERTYRSLKPGDFPTAKKLRAIARSDQQWTVQIKSCEDAWAERTVKSVLQETNPLLKSDPQTVALRLRKLAQDLASLDSHDAIQERLKTARLKAFRAALHDAMAKEIECLSQDKYQEIATISHQLKKQLTDEAKTLGVEAELTRFTESCDFIVELARLAGKSPAR
jgi:hypothetical protein